MTARRYTMPWSFDKPGPPGWKSSEEPWAVEYRRDRQNWQFRTRYQHDRIFKIRISRGGFHSWCKERRIAVEDVARAELRQGRRCAICRQALSRRGGQNYAVDHDHASGEFRGILCHACNLMLGGARDTVAFLFAAIRYLDSWRARRAAA